MALRDGIYHVLCKSDDGGRLALFLRPPGIIGEPIQCVPAEYEEPTRVRVEHLSGDRYRLTQARGLSGSLVIAARRDALPHMIMLLPSGTDDNITEWAINPSGPDVYVVHPPPESGCGDIFWTGTGTSTPIVLEGLEGKPTQHWTFKWEGVEPAIPV